MSLTAVRRLAISAQAYAPRHRTGSTGEVERAVRRLSCVQLDSISTVDRAHRLAALIPGARLHVVPRAWHLVQLDAPEALTGALQRWLLTGAG